MAATRVTEIAPSRDGSVKLSGTRNYTRVFRVEMSAATDGPGTAIRAIPVRQYDYYEEANGFVDFGALAEEASAQPEDAENCYNFIVTVNYSSSLWDEVVRGQRTGGTGTTGSPPHNPSAPNPTDSNSPANPVNRPAVAKWTRGNMRKAFEYEIAEPTAAPVANSAGDRFDPPFEKDVPFAILTIEQAQETFDIDTYEPYWDTVNDTWFFGWGPGFVKCDSITAVSQYENGYSYWLVTYEFHFYRGRMVRTSVSPAVYQREGWRLIVRDIGRNAFVAGVKQPIQVQGQTVADPVPLDGLGALLSDADVAAENFEYRVFERHLAKDFSLLPLRISL